MSTVQEIDNRRQLRDLPQWQSALVAWRRLGRFMPTDARDEAPVESPLGVLERCGWAECECHVHKPTHPIKICKGCWVVAYCGPRCQTR